MSPVKIYEARVNTEGVILHTLNFQEYDLILTVFTRDKGMLKFMYKGGNSRTRRAGAIVTPFTRVEVVYEEGKGDLMKLQEVATLQRYSELSSSLEALEAGCAIAKALLKTQLGDKPAELLYKLLISYLPKISAFAEPKILMTSFLLKLLRHEGLFDSQDLCSTCKKPLVEYSWDGQGCFCNAHAPPYAVPFSEEEAKLLYILAFSRSFEQMQALTMPAALPNKVLDIFQLAVD